MDDLELAKRLSQNDDEALQALVEGHYDPLYRFLRRLANGSDEAARELAQETLLQVRDSARGFRGRSALRTWILRIAFRTYSRQRRKHGWERVSESALSANEFDRSEDRIVFEQALDSLSPKLREAFILREVIELSVEEAAQILRVPEGTVKARVFRARHFLIQKLEHSEEIDYVAKPIEIRNNS